MPLSAAALGTTGQPPGGRAGRFIQRHPRAILVGWSILVLAGLLGVAELVLRHAGINRGDYYVGEVISPHLIRYPFGDMPFNSDGYPDRDWDPADPRERVGFWGDSITSGVGAGFGFRYTDLIGAANPHRSYLNFGGPGEDGVADEAAILKILQLVDRFGLKKVVYGMDLNDILPDRAGPGAPPAALARAKAFMKHYLDVLRAHSYLYDALRLRLTTAAMRMGYGYHGTEAFELDPLRHRAVIGQTVARINRLAAALAGRGVGLCVVIFPYEMQVSEDAAARYRRDGIHWSEALRQGEPQRMILSGLSPGTVAVDLAPAFRPGPDEKPARVGEDFVFNQGDLLDWVHPNRRGHRLVADYLSEKAPSCL
jgi:hypothetical protein